MSGGQAAERRISRVGRKPMESCREPGITQGHIAIRGSGQVGTSTRIPALDGTSCKLSMESVAPPYYLIFQLVSVQGVMLRFGSHLSFISTSVH